MIAAAQLRAARALLGWSQGRLAEAAGLSLPTIKRMEGEKGPGRSAAENVAAVQRTIEAAGVEFTPDGGVRPTAGGGERGEGRR